MRPELKSATEAWLASWPKPLESSLLLMKEHPDLTGRIRLLWHHDYWDGPRSGMVRLDGESGFWVKMMEDQFNPRLRVTDECASCTCESPDETCITWDRLFAVYKLTPEQIRIYSANHALFQQFVGMHTDYDENGNQLAWQSHPRSECEKYYKAEREQPPVLELNQIVGWATSIRPRRT